MLAVLPLLLLSFGLLLYFSMPHDRREAIKRFIPKSKTSLTEKIKRTIQTRSGTPRQAMATSAQEDCPLFSRIPGEIRDRIFQYAVTEHAFRKQEYEKNAHYYRPGFRFADQKIDTTLLLTCRRIHQETRHLPSRNYVQVEWCFRAPPNTDRQRRISVFARNSPNMEDLKSLHLFTQQFWLERWGDSADTIAKKMPNLHYLKITLRHGDWWHWENSVPLKFDPKQRGMANMNRQTQAGDPFDASSWGYQVRKFPSLRLLELELESIEGKRIELDDIVRHAPGWQFPISDTHVLILNPKETRRTGRIGLKLRKSASFSSFC